MARYCFFDRLNIFNVLISSACLSSENWSVQITGIVIILKILYDITESGQGHSQKLIRALTKAPLQRAVTQKRAASKTRLLRIILLRQLYTTSLCRIFALHLLAQVKLITHRRDNTATHKTMPHRDTPRWSLRDIFFAKYHIIKTRRRITRYHVDTTITTKLWQRDNELYVSCVNAIAVY